MRKEGAVTTPPTYSVTPAAPVRKATGGVLALGIINIVYSVLFRLCCGFVSAVGSLFAILFASSGMDFLANLQGMEGVDMPPLDAIYSGPMMTYNMVKGFVLLLLGIGLLAGGIGLLRLKPWGRTVSLGVAGAEIAWALVDFAVSVFFIYPSMNQMMGEDAAQMPQMIGSVVGGIFFTFMKLVYPVALLVCLNLKSIKDQFGESPPTYLTGL